MQLSDLTHDVLERQFQNIVVNFLDVTLNSIESGALLVEFWLHSSNERTLQQIQYSPAFRLKHLINMIKLR